LRAEDETWNGDPLLTKIIKDNSKVIEEHILFIRKVELQDLEDICRHLQFAEEAQHLQNLCSAYPTEIHKHDARCTILACAESLRKKLRRDELIIYQERIRTTVCLLSVYPAAYRTFRDVALEDDTFQLLEIQLVSHSHPEKHKTRRVKSLMNDINDMCRSTDTGALPVPHPKCNTRRSFLTASHAETQLVYRLEHVIDHKFETPHMYIGCSKKACWLCYHFLTNYTSKYGKAYLTRGSHGQVYTNWDTASLPVNAGSAAYHSLDIVKTQMLRLLSNPPPRFQRVMHESGSDTSSVSVPSPQIGEVGRRDSVYTDVLSSSRPYRLLAGHDEVPPSPTKSMASYSQSDAEEVEYGWLGSLELETCGEGALEKLRLGRGKARNLGLWYLSS
jgi:hypothetical protein